MATRLMIELNILQAINNYIYFGISGGTCTDHIIAGNYQEAYDSAHEHVKKDRHDCYTFDELYNNLRSMVPDSILDGKPHNENGAIALSDEELEKFVKELENTNNLLAAKTLKTILDTGITNYKSRISYILKKME